MRALALLVTALLFVPTLSSLAQPTGPSPPELPDPLHDALVAYALQIGDLVARAEAREDPTVGTYENASTNVHALLDRSLARSAALITADKLGTEQAVRLLRGAQLEADAAGYLRAETAALVERAEADMENATGLVAFAQNGAHELMAALYTGQIVTLTQGYISNHEALFEARALETRLIGPATRAASFARLAVELASVVPELDQGGAFDRQDLTNRLGARIDAFVVPDETDLAGNQAAARDALGQESLPIALAHYLQMVRIADANELEANVTASSLGAWAAARQNATRMLEDFNATERLEAANYPGYLAQETLVELSVAFDAAPGVAEQSEAHVRDMVRATARAGSMVTLAELLEAVPAESSRGAPVPFVLAPLALLGASLVAPGNRPRRRVMLVSLVALAAMAGLALAAGTALAQDAPPGNVPLEGLPGNPGRLLIVEAPSGPHHAVLQSFAPGQTTVYHGHFDAGTRTFSDWTALSEARHAMTPGATLLPDGTLQVAWWASDTEGPAIQALDSARLVARTWTASGPGPLEVVNATLGRMGSTLVELDHQDRVVIATGPDKWLHLYRKEAGTWTEFVAPSQKPVINNRVMTDLHRVEDGLWGAWVEETVTSFSSARKAVLMHFDGQTWSDRRVLSNFTNGLQLAGDERDPWAFFASTLLNANGDPVVGGAREVYGIPVSQGGEVYPVNISRTPASGERFELVATERGGRPMLVYFTGTDERGTALATTGPPFPAGGAVATWSLPSQWSVFFDSATVVGDTFFFTALATNVSHASVVSGDPEREAYLYEIVPPEPVDRADPEVQVLLPRAGGAYRELAQARGLVRDDIGVPNDGVALFLDGERLTSGVEVTRTGFTATLAGLDEGEHSLRVRVTDFAGNTTEVTVPFIIDRTPPRPSISFSPDPGDGWAGEPVTVTITGEDDLSGVGIVRYSTNNLTFPDYREPVVLGEPGLHRIWYVVFDRAGNRADLQRTQVRVDTSPPVIELELPSYAPGTATLSWTVTDPESGVASVERARVVDGVWTGARDVDANGQAQVEVPLPFARYGVSATNGAGLTASVVRAVAQDTGVPSLSVGALPARPGPVSIVASDDLGNVTVEVRVDDGDWTRLEGPPFSHDHDPAAHPEGERTFTVRATDEAGNAAWHNASFEGEGAPVAEENGAPWPGLVSLVAVGVAALARRRRTRQP